jgi:ABC-2 type transport system ATP-binding protein
VDRASLRLTGLSKRFGETQALSDVSLAVRPGEVFGYLGPNVAGKTTTIRLVMGMLRPTAGRAEVGGLDCWRDPVATHRLVGYVPGDAATYPRLTGRQHVDYFANLRHAGAGRRAAVAEQQARAGTLAERLDLDLHRRAGTLSRGNRQKLALVLALMTPRPMLVLDEPSTGLDPLVQQEFHARRREHTAQGGTVLLSSHVLGEVQRVADRIGVLRQGRLMAVEELKVLAAHSLHRVRATFLDDVGPADFEHVPGVRDVRVDGRVLTCNAPQHALDALLKRVAQHGVDDFECAEADLEETFLAFYAGDFEGSSRAA